MQGQFQFEERRKEKKSELSKKEQQQEVNAEKIIQHWCEQTVSKMPTHFQQFLSHFQHCYSLFSKTGATFCNGCTGDNSRRWVSEGGGGGEQIEFSWKLSFTKFEKTEKKRKWLKQISCPLEVFCKGM